MLIVFRVIDVCILLQHVDDFFRDVVAVYYTVTVVYCCVVVDYCTVAVVVFLLQR